MKVSFVIPTYNHVRLTNQLLLDIYTYSNSVDEVLILDNGGIERDTQVCVNAWMGSLPVRVSRLEENIGFLRVCNWGIPQASYENVVLISNDVRVQSDLANEVRAKLNYGNILGGVLYRGSTGWNEFDRRVFPYLEGWLLAFKKHTWENIGGFDEDFAPHDYEDIAFSTEAINLGYTLEQLEGNYTHLAAGTMGYNPERLAITERNKEIFRHKWVEK